MNNSFLENDSGHGNNQFGGSQIMSQGGGGYLNDSVMSDMAGAGTGMTPAKNRLSPNDPALLPCTIKQIKSAPAPQQDEVFCIDGRDVTKDNVSVVGRIKHINVESTHQSFTIDDGTGSLEVRFWATADASEASPYADLTEEIYVKCIGKVKNLRDNRSMTGFNIQKITDFNEITYHNLDVIHTHLINTMPSHVKDSLKAKLQFGASNNNNNNSSSNNNNNSNSSDNNNNNSSNNNFNNSFSFGNNNNNSSNNGNAGMNASMMSVSNNGGFNGNNNNASNGMMMDDERPPLHKKILNVLHQANQNGGESYDGLHVDRLFTLVGDDRNAIREALEQMSSDGVIFSTVDDETYNVSS